MEIEIVEPGVRRAGNGIVEITVLDGELFRRNAIIGAGTPEAHQVGWLVARLDGVSVYVNDGRILVTRQDVYPT